MPNWDEERGRRSLGALDGLGAFAGGVGFVLTTPRVWGYALVPVGMMLLLTCGLGVAGVWGAGRAGEAVFGVAPGTWGQVGSWALTVSLALVGFAVALLLALVMAQPLSGWALERISHAQERAMTGHAGPRSSFLLSFLVTLQAVLLSLAVGGPVLAVLFTINFFFPPAAVVTVPLKFLVCGWMLAWDFIDYPLSLRGLGLLARAGWVWRNSGAFTAFGLAWAGLVVIPGVVLLLLPMGVAGATRMVVLDEGAYQAADELVEVESEFERR
jgi:CysZ protein